MKSAAHDAPNAPQGESPRLGFGFCDLEVDPRGEPRVELELTRQLHDDALHPLSIPRGASLRLGGPLPDTLQEADIELAIDLEAGQHVLPVGATVPLLLQIEPGSRAEVRASLGSGPSGECELQSAEVRFSPALKIANLVGVASALGPLETLLGRLPEPLRVALEVGSASADLALSLELRGVQVAARVDGDGRWLQPSLQGSLRLLDRLAIPTDALRPPRALLPHLPPSLTALAKIPLVAELAKRIDGELRGALFAAAGSLVERVGGRLRAKLQPPAFSLGYRTADGTRRQLDINLAEPIVVEGNLGATGHGRRLSGEGTLRISHHERTRKGRAEGEVVQGAGTGAVRVGLDAELDLGGQHGGELELMPGLRQATVDIDLAPGSALPPLEVALWQENPLCRGRSRLDLRFEPLSLEGGLRLLLTPERLEPQVLRRCRLSTRLAPEASRLRLDAGELRLDNALDGDLELLLFADERPDGAARSAGRGLRWRIDFAGDIEHVIAAQINPIAELDLHDGAVRGLARSRSRLVLQPRFELLDHNATTVDLARSRFESTLESFELSLDRRLLELPAGSRVVAELRRGGLRPSSLSPAVVDLRWDLHGEPALLHFENRAVSLFTEELRSGEVTAHLDEGGKLSFSGSQEGLYGARYFNALLNPANDLAEWLEIFESDDAIRHVIDALDLFSPELAELLSDLRQLVLGARTILRREGVQDPRHVIPRDDMARILSLLLVGDTSLQPELVPIIKQATEGHGLPLAAVKHLLSRELGEFDIDYELNVVLNWLHLVLHAGEPYGPVEAPEEPPLPLAPEHRQAVADLPSAGEIYGRLLAGEIDSAFAERLAELAPALTQAMLETVLRRAEGDPRWPAPVLARLRYVASMKRRVARIGAGYGGVEHAAQPYTIAAFLGEAVGPLPGVNCPRSQPADQASWPPPCALGAADVATLLQAGLAMVRQDERAALNNRLLLELLRRRGSAFTREVLIELGHQSRRALSGILYALLEQDQDALAEPLDLPAFLEEQLGLEVPRQSAYLAGGRRARESYYEALDTLAERIIADGDAYLARKQHLLEERHPLPPPLSDDTPLAKAAAKAAERAQEAIAAADALGAQCQFQGRRRGPQKRAIKAYEKAFSACAALLEVEPRGFTLPWFKRFWWRNEAALRVLCSVRAYQDDLDAVRPWLARQLADRDLPAPDAERCRRGGPDEQQLVELFIETLFYEDGVREALRRDALLRLLIEPPAGRYDFSIVSCMGVITEGQDGNELVNAFGRLTRRRGIQVLRTDTATGRSLEHNAARIIEAIESCPTPWGIIGYSQGCANALLAEHNLHTGTPEQQAHVERLVCRNLLFSAANGSAHGSSAMAKYSRAMVAGERILKHYQATLSWQAVRIALRGMRAALDSQPFVETLAGGASLSFERAHVLHRDGQFLPTVPTSHSRAVVEEHRLPECLEYTYYCLEEMCAGAAQDTQVLATDAIGAATRVQNHNTRAFATCDMGSPILASHHWAPLTKEIEFVKTARDIERYAYDGPKDQLVWPWVEVNARFGRIKRSS